MRNYLAFDYGASSGRAIVGQYDGNTMTIREIHRFPNDPVMLGDTFYWDFPRLFHEMKQGLWRAGQEGLDIASVGVDTWGVDFGLLDAQDQLMQLPVHYRDGRTEGMMEKAFEKPLTVMVLSHIPSTDATAVWGFSPKVSSP